MKRVWILPGTLIYPLEKRRGKRTITLLTKRYQLEGSHTAPFAAVELLQGRVEALSCQCRGMGEEGGDAYYEFTGCGLV